MDEWASRLRVDDAGGGTDGKMERRVGGHWGGGCADRWIRERVDGWISTRMEEWI